MSPEMIELARRAVACKGWRFMGGMLVADAIGKQRIYDDVAGEPYWSTDGWLPDLTDPATLGCLLALVREAWGLPRLGVAFDHDADEWIVRSWNATILWQGLGNSEAEALVAAFEAAPR
jgi:hypothetical protein